MFWSRTTRDVIDVVGPDAHSYLQSQLSQDLRGLTAGDRVWSLVLQPTGKVDALMGVTVVGDDHLRLDVDAGYAEVVVARINRFKIRVKADVSSSTATMFAVWGDGTDFDLRWQQPDEGSEVAADALELARLDAVWPAMGREIVAGETIPAETGIVDRAVSFTKGCYPGQELVERMDSRGANAPRLLQRVTVAEGTRPGDSYRDGAGVVTSVHGTAALAYVKRSALTV